MSHSKCSGSPIESSEWFGGSGGFDFDDETSSANGDITAIQFLTRPSTGYLTG